MMQGFGSYQPQIQQAAAGFGSAPLADQQAPQPYNQGMSTYWTIYPLLGTVSVAACVYHGYKRNNSIGWAIGWGLLGGLFPVVTPIIAVAQGFGKPIGAKANRARANRRRARRASRRS